MAVGTDGRPHHLGEDIAVLRPEEIRQLEERRALVIAENGKPIIARLHRSIDGPAGGRLLAEQDKLRVSLAAVRSKGITPEARTTAALVEAKRRGLAVDGSHQ